LIGERGLFGAEMLKWVREGYVPFYTL
jgi:hypothetical protein